MRSPQPFIPTDKPRSWVIGTTSGLLGLFFGLVAFVAAWTDLRAVQSLATGAFVICWLAFAISWLVFLVGLLTGRYSDIQARPWREQLW